MRLLWALDHGLQSRSKRMDAELGVTGPQRIVVRLLGRLPRTSPSQLAELLHVHRSTMTGILQRLEGRGFVRRLGDPDDGRRSFFELTETGKRIDEQRAGTAEAAVRRALARVRPQELGAVREVLSTLVEELGREDLLSAGCKWFEQKLYGSGPDGVRLSSRRQTETGQMASPGRSPPTASLRFASCTSLRQAL